MGYNKLGARSFIESKYASINYGENMVRSAGC